MRLPRYEQLDLFETEALPPDNGSTFSDPASASNKSLPLHRWVPWIAGFSSEFVHDALSRYLSRPGVVLDPFAGVGTTLIEAVLCGHDAVGFEINPYAALACRVKVDARRVAVDELRSEMKRFHEFYSTASGEPKSTPPEGFKTRAAFFSPQVLQKVLVLQDFIDTIQNPGLQDLFKVAFASTMIQYSNYSYEPSLGRRVSAGKPEIQNFPVGEAILHKLSEAAQDIAWFQANARSDASARVINDSFFAFEDYLSSESVDLVMTSPPYLNNYHYNRNTRPQLYWLGFVKGPEDLKPLETANFGKYWQTVRHLSPIDLDFDLPGTALTDQLKVLRSLNTEKGIYGGSGWANYAASYFNDCYQFAQGLRQVLKAGGVALVVVGNSILQGILIPTDQYFGKIAERAGLELVDIEIPRAVRVGNSIIQSDVRAAKAKQSHRLYEAVVVLRKRLSA
ncbi:MAG: site-specific DNA-methyltransferase [Anaerolineae bacterium]|nr:site-specific DNA-methyltransferase [Anaerolineae bacterium]